MKLTKSKLKQIIKEELANVLGEESIDEEQIDENRYDCEKDNCRGKTGSRKEECIKNCIEAKKRESDKRAEKSMRRGW